MHTAAFLNYNTMCLTGSIYIFVTKKENKEQIGCFSVSLVSFNILLGGKQNWAFLIQTSALSCLFKFDLLQCSILFTLQEMK